VTSAFSGHIQAKMLPTRTTFDLLGGMWSLLQEAGAVSKQLVRDNESGIGQGRLTEPPAAFAGVMGCEIRQLPPRDPESKGIGAEDAARSRAHCHRDGACRNTSFRKVKLCQH
jgi:hypothetical protein